MQLRDVSSLILDEGGARPDLESFTVCYDFLSRVDRRFVRSQKMVLTISIACIVIGIILFISSLAFIPFVLIPSTIIVVIGLVALVVFQFRAPKDMVQFEKVYWPIALVNVPAVDVDAAVTIDTTGVVWNDKYEILAVDQERLDKMLGSLPETLTSHAEEKKTVKDIQSAKELTVAHELAGPLADDSYLENVIHLTREIASVPANTMHGIGWNNAERLGSELSELKEIGNSQAGQAARAIELLNTRVGQYLRYLEALHRAEVEYMTTHLARFMGEVEHIPELIDPMIKVFIEEAKDGLATVERFCQRELEMIEERLLYDQRFVDIQLDRLIMQTKIEQRRMRKEKGVRESKVKCVNELIAMLQALKDANMSPVLPSLAESMKMIDRGEGDIMDFPQMLLDVTQEAAGMAVFLEQGERRRIAPDVMRYEPDPWSGEFAYDPAKDDLLHSSSTESQHRMDDQLTLSQIKRYDSMAQRIRPGLERARLQLKACHDELGHVADDLSTIVEEGLKHVETQFMAGRRSIEATDVSKEREYRLVRKNVIRLEGLQMFTAQALIETQAMLVEETARHLRPYAERGQAFEQERARIEKEMRAVIGASDGFDKKVRGCIMRSRVQGMFYLPYWMLRTERKGSSYENVYSMSSIDQKGFLKTKFKDLVLSTGQVREMKGADGPKMMLDLARDIKEGRKAFLAKVKVSSLDSYIVAKGVGRLGKKG